MKRVQKRICVLIGILIIAYITLSGRSVFAEEYKKQKWKVLFISTYNSNFMSFNEQVDGIKSGFEDNIELRVEYMDVNGYFNKESEKKFYNLLKSSFENYQDYDAVIAGDDEALEFCLKYRNDIFDNVPISFLGVQKESVLKNAFNYEDVSGVREVESVEANLDLIKKFHPQIKNIVFLNDKGEHFYDDIISDNTTLNFKSIITEDLSIYEFKRVLNNLKDDTAIISLYPSNFKNGEWLKYLDINKLIAEINPKIPIYNVLKYAIGNGSVGGKVINHFNQGKRAGQIALGLLEGKDPKDLYIGTDEANEYVFDYNTVKKFKIGMKNLPENSKVINNPIDIIKQYKNAFIGLGIIFMTLILLILSLIKYIHYKRIYEKEILTAMKKVEEDNKIKANFISNISHELKTPINVILCAIQLVESNCCGNSKNRNTMNIIKDNCYRLIRLMNNMIDIEKAELNDLKLSLENTNVVNLVEELVMSVIPYAEKKNLNLVFDTDEEEIMMNLDISKIERVILNLLSNAIKFSKENGDIYVTINSQNEELEIIVEDNGIGISEENKRTIFEKFTQVDTSLNRKNEGSGTGLSLANALVKLHNGEITVQSEINKGTKFIVKLPKEINIDKNSDLIDYKKENYYDINVIDKVINTEHKTRAELSDIYM
ncbi:ABC transporter substrate binding protein [Clostridium sp.]|uniref:sensor histidine kinase n=1 Tax=Clostridium sp. TaxID=1506 RepID=UPI0025C542F5|nr:ABC transporter substrate binding protein [Clostridium sp.]MCI9304189.1 histidine kinase [Clostridium sp.]